MKIIFSCSPATLLSVFAVFIDFYLFLAILPRDSNSSTLVLLKAAGFFFPSELDLCPN